MSTIVYHGGTDKIEHPLSDIGRANLDFGLGFYVTEIPSQAIEWAKKVADHRPNNQMCLLSQQLIDKYLIFHGAESI